MKPLSSLLVVLAALLIGAMPAHADKKEKNLRWSVEIVNAATGDLIPDTLVATLMSPDSSIIESRPIDLAFDKLDMPIWSMILFNKPGRDFILRLEHPDYETFVQAYHIDKDGQDFKARVRKLTKGEKARMLDEVVVTASVVEFINKGDTIQYNADAFELAEGSMLGALIRRLPGAELRENGQIYVNGRFVDKLLLDGRDFFKNDKLVLLQNLPAYAVKNIQVYEQNTAQQLAEKGGGKPDYVMDVKLKKDFNAGWLANAEAGGGTHSRYRLRGFGLLYNTRHRFAVYALANNLNETGSPDMSGEWKKPGNLQAEIVTKGGGFDYSVEPNDNVGFEGSTTVLYKNNIANMLVNVQRYLPDGDQYTRRWNHNRTGALDITSTNKYKHSFTDAFFHSVTADFNYGSDRTRSEVTEGTALSPSTLDSLGDYSRLLNRYLSLSRTDAKRAEGKLAYFAFLDIGEHFSLYTQLQGNLNHRWSDESQQYLLQTAGAADQTTNRVNPAASHGYSYRAEVHPGYHTGISWFNLEYNIASEYTDANTFLYDLAEAASDHLYGRGAEARGGDRGILPADRAGEPMPGYRAGETMPLPPGGRFSAPLTLSSQLSAVLDPRNSYVYGLHSTEHTFEFNYNLRDQYHLDNGWNSDRFQIVVAPQVRLLRRHMDFNGLRRQLVSQNTWLPGVSFWTMWAGKKYHHVSFDYQLTSHAPAMTNLIDVEFTSDPLHLVCGNPDLKYTLSHYFGLSYNSRDFLWGHLKIYAQAYAKLHQNSVQYATAYNRATGVRTTTPVNVNGCRDGLLYISLNVRPERSGRFTVNNSLAYVPERYVSYISADGEEGFRRSVSHYNRIYDVLELEYKSHPFTVALRSSYQDQKGSSRTADFADYSLKYFSYGLRGLVRLPLDFEISTNIDVARRMGYTDPVLNRTQVIWNARISKSILGGSLQFALDGYDMLRQLKRIEQATNATSLTQTRYDAIPSYFMFSVRYFFAKKPRK